jgi:bla regulator protein BlaR1
MQILIGIALKSMLIAGITLGLLQLLKRRSAAERSWIAHIGLLALIIIALAPLALPRWNVEAPALLSQTPATVAAVQTTPVVPTVATVQIAASPSPKFLVPEKTSLSPTAVVTALYAVPAAILLLITLLALARLVALQHRAEVLVDGHWLSALARAQRRMGFKHGTALLTSKELPSPISWGLVRPVIVLNERAVEASSEAEAIIAHELAHVARMDWVKLLLARFATALFWFNPFVWLLAREAHQLREEAADDAVLAADIAETDYAELLVGVARHECPGMLLGAHGVAPSKNSLARRVARVLDGTSVRGPAARSFAFGIFVGAVLIAAPLAALNLTPASPSRQHSASLQGPGGSRVESAYDDTGDLIPTDLPHIIAKGVSTSVRTVASASALKEQADERRRDAEVNSRQAMQEAQDSLQEAQQQRREALDRSAEATRLVHDALKKVPTKNQIDQLVEMKTLGITPDYVRELSAAGLRNLSASDLAEARSIGLTGDYARAVAGAGVPVRLNDYIELRSSGVPTHYLISIQKSGHAIRNVNKIIEMWAVHVNPEDLKVLPPFPPAPPLAPRRTGRPAASPPNWNDPSGDG